MHDSIDKATRHINLMKRSIDISEQDKELLRQVQSKDQGLRVLEQNQKLLQQLLEIERNLLVKEKAKTRQYLRKEHEKFVRNCSCH